MSEQDWTLIEGDITTVEGARIVDLERQLAEAQATIERLAEAHVERFDKAADHILRSKEGKVRNG